MKTMFCFLQGVGFQEIFILIFIPAFFFGIFLAVRAIMLWYWKINTIVDKPAGANKIASGAAIGVQ